MQRIQRTFSVGGQLSREGCLQHGEELGAGRGGGQTFLGLGLKFDLIHFQQLCGFVGLVATVIAALCFLQISFQRLLSEPTVVANMGGTRSADHREGVRRERSEGGEEISPQSDVLLETDLYQMVQLYASMIRSPPGGGGG
jgi:hypothetical protein